MIMFGTKKYDERIKNAYEAQGTYGGGVGGSSNVQGYNPLLVSTCLSKIQSSADAIYDDGGAGFNAFVTDISTLWYGQDAVDEFAILKEGFDSYLNSVVNPIFTNAFASINSAATNWATTAHETWGNVEYTNKGCENTTNTEAILSQNANGDRSFDTVNVATTAVTDFTTIKSNIDSAVDIAIQAAQNSGFLGGSQTQQLVSSFNSIKTRIEGYIKELLDTHFVNRLDTNSEEHKDLTAKVEEAFGGGSGE